MNIKSEIGHDFSKEGYFVNTVVTLVFRSDATYTTEVAALRGVVEHEKRVMESLKEAFGSLSTKDDVHLTSAT